MSELYQAIPSSNPCYMYHCPYSVQYTFGFHLCSYSVSYITTTIKVIGEDDTKIKVSTVDSIKMKSSTGFKDKGLIA